MPTDTQERKRVGKVAQQNLKQFKEALDKEHTLLFRKDLGFLLYQVGERLFQEHKNQWNSEHYGQNCGSRKLFS